MAKIVIFYKTVGNDAKKPQLKPFAQVADYVVIPRVPKENCRIFAPENSIKPDAE